MKTRKASLPLVLSLCSVNALADGVVIFSNTGAPPEDRIYFIHWSHTQPSVIDEGPTPLYGADYHIALYWGPQGTPEQALLQVGTPANFQTFPAMPGMFFGGSHTIPTVEAGPVLTFQARAWAGDYISFEHALAVGNTAVGKGPVFDFDTKDPGNLSELPRQISHAPGWQGFCIDYDFIGCDPSVIPEPSTVALAILGGAALLGLRRVNRKS
jgi:hypothetical protein